MARLTSASAWHKAIGHLLRRGGRGSAASHRDPRIAADRPLSVSESDLTARLRLSRDLLEAIPVPVSVRDPAGRFVLVNRAFEDWHAVHRADVLDQKPSDVLPASVTLAFARCDALALEQDGPVDQEVDLRPQDTSLRFVQLRVQVIRCVHGEVAGSMAVATDVTPLRDQEVELTRLNEQLSRVSALIIDAQEQERRSIARDLHDDVGQALTAMKMSLVMLARSQRAIAPADLAPVAELIDEVVHRVRDLTASLYPQVLDDLGIEPATEWLLERYVRPAVPDVTLQSKLTRHRSAQDVEIVAFRVVQEALTNAVRHAGAQSVGVLLHQRQDHLHVEVIDDGAGFEAGPAWLRELPGRSIGIASMRNRVEEVGGDLRVDSSVGSGTSVRVRLPWPDAAMRCIGGAA